MPLTTPAEVFSYLGISRPTTDETAAMTLIVNGLQSSVIRFCHWCVLSASHVNYLPFSGQRFGSRVLQLEYQGGGGRDRLQLPQMNVTAVSEIRIDSEARGPLTGYFAAATIVDPTTYFLETDGGGSISESGGLFRLDACWPSQPGTVKASFTAGYTEGDLLADHNSLRLATDQEAALHFVLRQQRKKTFVDGISGDTTGLLASERLGDWEASWRKPDTSGDAKSGGSYSLSEDMRTFLQDMGYVFCGVGF